MHICTYSHIHIYAYIHIYCEPCEVLQLLTRTLWPRQAQGLEGGSFAGVRVPGSLSHSNGVAAVEQKEKKGRRARQLGSFKTGVFEGEPTSDW